MSEPGPELRIVGEIAQAFLTARQPTEVYRLALERVAPLVNASFACVFLRDGSTDLLKIVSAYNWPQRYANYLGSMRVRVGNGPTGRAVLENRSVDVADVFGDAELEDWWDSARELGFTSSIALPLSFEAIPVGALTFYFRNRDAFADADRRLLRLVADQLAATAERAHLFEHLERANEQLTEQNVELELRYREAEESRRLKNEFIANISHELRTPLTAILGYAYLIKEGVMGPVPPDPLAAVEKIEAAGGHLMTLIEGLLDLSALKLSKVDPDPTLNDANELARTAFSQIGEPPPNVKLALDLAPGKLPIHTDASLVRRVLRGLLSNALKFTREGTVTLKVRSFQAQRPNSLYPLGPEIVWEVRDTGIGIDPAMQGVIFDEFRQGDGSATRRYGGAGLGLAVARGIAHRLGGDITVESTLGEGATFRFSLPSSVIHAGVS